MTDEIFVRIIIVIEIFSDILVCLLHTFYLLIMVLKPYNLKNIINI